MHGVRRKRILLLPHLVTVLYVFLNYPQVKQILPASLRPVLRPLFAQRPSFFSDAVGCDETLQSHLPLHAAASLRMNLPFDSLLFCWMPSCFFKAPLPGNCPIL
jgi:hypothetical protein